MYHRHIVDDDYYDDKIIGVYSTYCNAKKVIRLYSNLPGFAETLAGFHIEPFYISLPKKLNSNYKIYLYILIEEKIFEDYELCESYVVYSNKIKAIWGKFIKKIRLGFFKNIRLSIDKYCIDENNWCEGFVTII